MSFNSGESSRYPAFKTKLINPNLSKIFTEKPTLALDYLQLSDSEQLVMIIAQIRKVSDELKQEMEAEAEAELAQQEEDLGDFGISGLRILVEVTDISRTGTEYFVYDEDLDELSDLTYDGLHNLLPPKLFATISKYPCAAVYEPSNAKENFDEVLVGQRAVTRVNMYTHPVWRRGKDLGEFSGLYTFESLPRTAQDFLRHLFPSSDSLDYVLSWLSSALRSRQGNEHILVLSGQTGTGKTIFATELMIALFKLSNWGTAPKNLFDSAFNSVLRNKRLIIIDEAKIGEKEYNTVKLYANKKLNLEAKGVDANNSTDLFYSMILMNNKMSNIYVDPDDRRFSIVETANKKFEEAFGEDFYQELLADIADPVWIEKLGEFLLEYEVGAKQKQFKGVKFYAFVWRHLSQWKKMIVGKIQKAGKEGESEIELDRLTMAIKNDKHIRYDVQQDTIIEFIESYLHGIDKASLGVLGDDGDGNQVVEIGEYFLKNEIDKGEALL